MHKFDLQNNYIDEGNTWSDILAATSFLVWSTYHTMLQATSIQLVFVHDMMFNTPLIYSWEYIRRKKQEIIDEITKIKI